MLQYIHIYWLFCNKNVNKWSSFFVANNSTWIPAFVTWLINKEITRHGWTREKICILFLLIHSYFFFAVLSHLLLILCLWWWRSSHYDFDHVIRIFFFNPFKASHHHFPTYVVIFQCWSRKNYSERTKCGK